MDAVLEKLGEALGKIDRPGAFCTSGSAPAVLPGLEVEGLGAVGLPLSARQAKELKTHCERAPYGKGEQTVVDTKVRRVWRMEPGRFALTNPDWGRFLEETVAKVQAALGLEKQALEGHLYDLLLYEPGSFFLPHRDGEKLDRMVATLVIVLPSSYEGGEIVVRHDGQEQSIDLGGAEDRLFRIHYAAFYADCEHEVRPLRKGYRLCLVYNLTLAKAKSKTPIRAPRVSQHVEQIVPLLRRWAEDESAWKLAITLDHQYTKDGLAWDALKGADRAKAGVLLEAARRAGCMAYLALLTFWESGSAEYSGGGYGRRYGGRRGWGGYDEDAEDYEMGEIYDTSLTAEGWTDSEGNGLPIGTLKVKKDELLDPESLTDVDPEEDFEGYTGNAGMTITRWYRHAAIFVWPERRHFEILCDRDSRAVVPVLERMVASRKEAPAGEAAALRAKCLDFAAAILANWPERSFVRGSFEGPEAAGDLLGTLLGLDDPASIGRFLGEVMVRDVSAVPGQALAAACQKYGWGAFREELEAVMAATNNETIVRNVRLLEQVASARPRKKAGWAELCAGLAQRLVSAVESVDQAPRSTDWRSRSDPGRDEVLAGLARALIVSGQVELLGRVVTHALGLPKVYPLTSAHIPALEALRPWIKKTLKGPCPPLSRWVASCREQLEAITAEVPKEPRDFRRSATLSCKCADCAEVKRFLADPRESAYRYSARQERRNHVANQIGASKADLDLETIRKGSPHVLVCTKNKASYLAKMKTYHRDQEYLAMVRAIEASLPK